MLLFEHNDVEITVMQAVSPPVTGASGTRGRYVNANLVTGRVVEDYDRWGQEMAALVRAVDSTT